MDWFTQHFNQIGERNRDPTARNKQLKETFTRKLKLEFGNMYQKKAKTEKTSKPMIYNYIEKLIYNKQT